MPTSATGADRGFTLVELMIVLAIIGLMSAGVVLAMPDPRGRLIDDAERFAARVQATRDGAIIDAREKRVQIDPLGYRFEERRMGTWRAIRDRGEVHVPWATGTAIAVGRDARKTISFDTTGLASEAAVLTLRREGERIAVSIGQDGAVRVAR